MKLQNVPALIVGFVQAAGVYVWLLASFFLFSKLGPHTSYPGVAWLLMAVAILPTWMFSYPVFLLIQKKPKRAWQVTLYTIMWLLAAFFVALIIDGYYPAQDFVY